MKNKKAHCKNNSKIPTKNLEKIRKIDTTKTYYHEHDHSLYGLVHAFQESAGAKLVLWAHRNLPSK